MNSQNPFLQLVPNRAAAALRRVRGMVWYNRRPLTVLAAEPTADHQDLGAITEAPLKEIASGEAWGRLYDQRWFKIELSERERGETRYLEWRDQGEATLHVNGTPYYGFDVAHRFVALPPKAEEVWIEGYCCQSAIWHPDAAGLSPSGSLFGGAYLVNRNDLAWEVMNDLQCLVDLMMHLRAAERSTPTPSLNRFGHQPGVEQAAPLYRRLLRLLDQAVDRLDEGGMAKMREILNSAYSELRNAKSALTGVLTGHAHIDLVWLWPERMGEAKAVHTFASVNRLMNLYPEFRFAYSQPASYRAVERRSPGLARAVKRRIRSGRWQPTGGLDVESDTLLPCGEALARSFLLGQVEFNRLRGSPARLLWLPDVFGYSACLPQLMRLAGIEWFFTTKLTWSAINRFPYSSFVWRGSDGSEVLAHVSQNVGYNNRVDLGELESHARGHVQSDVHSEFLHPTGYGDGGGGPTEEMCERVRRFNALAGTPSLVWDQPEAFFERLSKNREALPVWKGECYLEYHRGTYTTHGELKQAFRDLESALRTREAVASALGLTPDLKHAWRRMVFAQFHDYIPGSSVPEVYDEGIPELRHLAEEQRLESESDLSEKAGDFCAFNPLPLPWSGWVLNTSTGKPDWLTLPPLGGAALASASGRPGSVSVRRRVLDNGLVRASIDANGRLKALKIDGKELDFSGPATIPILYPDFPVAFESWDIDRAALSLGKPLGKPQSIEIEKTGDDSAVLAVKFRIGMSSGLILRYCLVAGESVLRLDCEIDWHEENALLKLHFPTNYRGDQVRFGAPFGSVLRPQSPGPMTTEAQWEVPGSRWAAVARDGESEGLAVMTESKYGFLARDGDLSVSLLRSPRITGSDEHRYIAPPGLRRRLPVSEFADQGRHQIRLAIGAYAIDLPAGDQPANRAESLFCQPVLYRGKPVTAGFLGVDGGPTLAPAWAIPMASGAWVLRLHEVGGQKGKARLQLADGYAARLCQLDGSSSEESSHDLNFSYGPYQILSVRIERGNA